MEKYHLVPFANCADLLDPAGDEEVQGSGSYGPTFLPG